MTKPAPAEDQVLTTRTERGTYLAARRLAAAFRGDEVVFLTGELGAGKTVFARGIAAGLGMKNPRLVCSPSYTLINIYQGRVPILHLDLYRLGGQAEIRDLGFEDHIGEAVILIEWASGSTSPWTASASISASSRTERGQSGSSVRRAAEIERLIGRGFQLAATADRPARPAAGETV
ncbi:MAG TPA: tRNA (adenosine(37)-N6)-threonylcarbamoyltransferase complex ATPase subunit type 1 TsaE [Candidatus Aminicenantes bacterium]|nr:tRNA (adenosine(37)-N6)-threonylcarbamoyltransferase complex ATPase subunit type 1 TsaE [Candidatus Aminicenantes bacterium]